MKFDAKDLRKQHHKKLRETLEFIVNKHLTRIRGYIQVYKDRETYIYTVDNVIHGYKSYNPNTNGQVYKHIVKKLEKEGYQISCIEPNHIHISWKNKNEEAFQRYLSSLLVNIFKCIQQRVKLESTELNYTIPLNVSYPIDRVCSDIITVLQKKNFKVFRRKFTLLIKW